MKTVITNIFIALTVTTLFVCYDFAHTPKVEVKAETQKLPEAQIEKVEPLTKFIIVKVSHYWPDLGGVNCFNFKNGKCVSRMADGEKWQSQVGLAIACPKELPFGTRIRIGDRIWTCKDRGSAIVKVDNTYWVDQLTPEALYPYGQEVEAELYLK